MSYHSKDPVVRQLDAHLQAAERNPAKRAQHLLAAARYAIAAGLHHFGLWDIQSQVKRNARRVLREQERKLKNKERR
jgi:hypothetical protein